MSSEGEDLPLPQDPSSTLKYPSDTRYYTNLTKDTLQSTPSTTYASPVVARTSISSAGVPETIQQTVRQSISQLRLQPPSQSAASDPSKPMIEDSSNLKSIQKRHLHLPPIRELEAYLMDGLASDGSADNFLNILPDLAEALAAYVQLYPDQIKPVWASLRPVLRDIRRRNRLHGRLEVRPSPPVCPKRPSTWQTVHGQEIHDDYAWLKNKDDPEVMNYLEAENNFAKSTLNHTKTLQKVLFKEFVSRLDDSEETARVRLSDGWYYYSKKVPGQEYRLHCRMDKNGFEDIYLNENQLASEQENPKGGDPYFALGFLKHTTDCSVIAYGIDNSGIERYTTYFMEMETKRLLPDIISDCSVDLEMSNCGRYVFYVLIDQFERSYQWKRHVIGKPTTADDDILYEETDDKYYLTMTKSTGKRIIILNSAAQITSESRFIDLSNPLQDPIVLFPRRQKIQYTVEHHYFPDASPGSQLHRGYFFVMTNENSKNHRLFRLPMPSLEDFKTKYKDGISPEETKRLSQTVVDNRDFVLIEAFQVRAKHLIVFERSNCMQNIRIIALQENGSLDTYHYVSFPEGVYSVWPGSVDEEVADLSKSMLFDTNVLRFTYTSFVQPKQVIDYNMDTRVKTVVHEERVPGPGYDKSLYSSKRLWATGVDGTAVPISLVYRRDLLGVRLSNMTDSLGSEESPTISPVVNARSAGNPLLLHGYGAYGCCVSPIFSSSRLSLLDRGFVYAIAHVRGGSDMGNGWYKEGKLGKKVNTFLDFISCADYLIKEGYTSTDKLAIYGRSAGGLLIGSVVNMRPDMFKAVLTEVPFVDVINTMFDPTIPWTAFEYEEWGNPDDPEICAAMNAYCPYSNIRSGILYPNMLVVGGMNDPRVAFFEPTKWTAKLRAKACWSTADLPPQAADQTGAPQDHCLLLKIQDAGHGGSSGQYGHLEDLAFEYAFLISTLGAQFRPVSSGGKGLSLNGVDYDMYWDEFDEGGDAVEDDEEEEEAELEEKPITPLSKFSALLQRRAKKSSSHGNSRRSSRTNSRADTIGRQRHRQTSVERDSVSAIDLNAKQVSQQTYRSASRPASMRYHVPTTQDEFNGRIQSTSRVYNFLSKFF